MADKPDDLDAIFEEAAQITGSRTDASMAQRNSPEGIAKAKADLDRDIRLGVKNNAGEWIMPDDSESSSDDA